MQKKCLFHTGHDVTLDNDGRPLSSYHEITDESILLVEVVPADCLYVQVVDGRKYTIDIDPKDFDVSFHTNLFNTSWLNFVQSYTVSNLMKDVEKATHNSTAGHELVFDGRSLTERMQYYEKCNIISSGMWATCQNY